MFSLDRRLHMCASLVRDGARLVDVGSDHAYLPVWLLKNGRISFAIASDVNEKPLLSGRQTADRYGAENIEFRLGSGLETVSGADNITDVVIAGMGGELIADILRCSPFEPDGINFILQPMTRAEVLVRFLCESGYRIDSMKAVTDHGKTYAVINSRYDGVCRECGEAYAYVGELNPEDPESRRYINKIIRNLENKARGDETVLPLLEQLREL